MYTHRAGNWYNKAIFFNIVIDSPNSVYEKSTLYDIPMVDKIVQICMQLVH